MLLVGRVGSTASVRRASTRVLTDLSALTTTSASRTECAPTANAQTWTDRSNAIAMMATRSPGIDINLLWLEWRKNGVKIRTIITKLIV